jgi:hypothetical protein
MPHTRDALLAAARDRGRRWARFKLEEERGEAGWTMPATCPRYRQAEFLAILVDELPLDEVCREMVKACYEAAREAYNEGRKRKQEERQRR